MRDKELVEYLNSIDFSMIKDKIVLNNIYNEILPQITDLSKDPFASTSLEKLIGLSNSSNLLRLLNEINRNTVYKKLGSRIIESVYKRLFDCLYKENDFFLLKSVIEFLNISECLDCHNATFVVRQALMLLSGKRIEKLEITKYKIPDSAVKENNDIERGNNISNGRTDGDSKVKNNTSNYMDGNNTSNNIDGNNTSNCIDGRTVGDSKINNLDNCNSEYSKSKLAEIKDIFIKKIPSFDSNDQFNTLGTFIQISKSQSLIEFFLQRDCSYENIIKRGFLYELIATVASKKNLALIFDRIENSIFDLAIEEKSSYFIQSFLRNSIYCKEIFRILDFNQFDSDSNVILALLESLQINSMHLIYQGDFISNRKGEFTSQNLTIENKENLTEFGMIKALILDFYKFQNCSVFKAFLFEKFGSIDTKCIKVVSNFMRMPNEFSYHCNEDFLKFFEKDWIKLKGGIALAMAFAEGSCERNKKIRFFNENIDIFWECYKWKNSKEFIKRLCDLTTGHSRKKAFEISKRKL